jgi:hypothetical protein
MQQLAVKWVGKSRGRENRESETTLAQKTIENNNVQVWQAEWGLVR